MTIALIIAIISTFAAPTAYAYNHQFLCNLFICTGLTFALSAISSEGKILNRVRKLEKEIETLKEENHHAEP